MGKGWETLILVAALSISGGQEGKNRLWEFIREDGELLRSV